jgi:hypothetical protein
MLTILSLCDYSGVWSKPYKDAGYYIMQIDIKRGDDVRLLSYPGEVYGIIAAPPCTHFCSSGARWWKDKGQSALLEGLEIVDACLRFVAVCNPVFWALENPVGRLVHYIGPPAMKFDPWEFGDPYTKKTCLWGKFNIPKRTPCEPISGIAEDGHNNPRKRFPSKMHLLPPTADRSTLRSMTPEGFAKAFFEANR